ncbi:hypothetical protein ANCCAN_24929 [Ancylostoma caninum]|uniref:Uncharacterized protein n=1 Tax=Ancylostoma caninum TaxID=29170 RepID=A0A368FAZ0_ANCCA|nr:hypothetical protein ANCCAN_24929 [Ancylostoma caninum]
MGFIRLENGILQMYFGPITTVREKSILILTNVESPMYLLSQCVQYAI